MQQALRTPGDVPCSAPACLGVPVGHCCCRLLMHQASEPGSLRLPCRSSSDPHQPVDGLPGQPALHCACNVPKVCGHVSLSCYGPCTLPQGMLLLSLVL